MLRKDDDDGGDEDENERERKNNQFFSLLFIWKHTIVNRQGTQDNPNRCEQTNEREKKINFVR